MVFLGPKAILLVGVAEWKDVFKRRITLTKRNKEVVLCLVQINIHTYISNISVYIYIIYLFEIIVSKAWPTSSVFFKMINIIFHGVALKFSIFKMLGLANLILLIEQFLFVCLFVYFFYLKNGSIDFDETKSINKF